MRMNRLVVLAALLAACGTEPEPPPPPPPNNCCGTPPPSGSCAAAVDVALQPGQHVVVNPTDGGGCVRFPAAGGAGAEYVYAALATNGTESSVGSSVTYRLTGASVLSTSEAATAAAALPPHIDPSLEAFSRPKSREAFHGMLRAKERGFSQSAGISLNLGSRGTSAVVPPTVGHQRTFQVCETTSCSDFVAAPATARFVGAKAAIYTDDVPPPGGGYSAAEIEAVGQLFDDYLYPIDTTAFGRESDLDNNGVVVVLLTKYVNALSPSCNAEGSVILGYFYGSDLLPNQEGSNGGEVFYSLVPDPDNASCTISLDYAREYVAPTFIHEFQHMISFNQHVLIRNGSSEDTWLNEGLSHFAEELGGRAIPDDQCSSGDCFTQFVVGDAGNAYRYLRDVEAHFLIEPGSSGGTLEERGANWLFVRWLADHFGADENGTALTRALVGTNRLGAANVAAVTGTTFATLVPEWQLANYLDNLPGFTPASARLQYESWDFRATFAAFNSQSPGSYPRPYPLVPDSTLTGVYSRQGTLRAGSGRHLRIVQAPLADPVTLHLTDGSSQTIGTSTAAPRIAIARVR